MCVCAWTPPICVRVRGDTAGRWWRVRRQSMSTQCSSTVAPPCWRLRTAAVATWRCWNMATWAVPLHSRRKASGL
eukprot:7036844-Prymnesium_polylepis.1